MSLFRREALDAQRQSWLGEIAVMRPIPLSVGVGVVVVAFVAVVAFLCLATYERKARVSGLLVTDREAVRVLAPEGGTVVETLVHEGQSVRQGDALFVLAPDRAAAPADAQMSTAQGAKAMSREGSELSPTLGDHPESRRQDNAGSASETDASTAQPHVVIRAPTDGVMEAPMPLPGQPVGAASLLGALVPTGSVLQAQLLAPSGVVGYVQAGQPVLLRYQAFAYAKYGHQTGRVLRVSRTPMQASDVAALPLAGLSHKPAEAISEPLYRITVALDQQSVRAYDQAEPQPLLAGMQVEADVGLERRRLIEWMFEPLLGLAGRLGPARP